MAVVKKRSWYTTPEVARYAGMSHTRLVEWARAGIVRPTTPSRKQGSWARWSERDAEIVAQLWAIREQKWLTNMADVQRAVEQATGVAFVVIGRKALRLKSDDRVGKVLRKAGTPAVLVRVGKIALGLRSRH